MLVLRKPLLRPLLQIIRSNATVAHISQSPQVPPPLNEGAKTHGRRRRKIPPKRPDISLENPRKWNRPLGEGVVPAYDLALHVLRRDSKNLKAEVKILRAQIAEKEKEYKALQERADALPEAERVRMRDDLESLDEELEELMKKADIVEVQGEVNLPSVRWTLNNAMGM
jgi:large subunit ribosomal protein L35